MKTTTCVFSRATLSFDLAQSFRTIYDAILGTRRQSATAPPSCPALSFHGGRNLRFRPRCKFPEK
jgi:hypothetical protein